MNTLTMQESFANKIAHDGIKLIRDGKVRNHKLGNNSRIHSGEVEKKEYQTYRDFLPSRNCCMVYELLGSDCYE